MLHSDLHPCQRRDVGVAQKLLDECGADTLREPESVYRIAEADQQTLSKLLSKSPRCSRRGLRSSDLVGPFSATSSDQNSFTYQRAVS